MSVDIAEHLRKVLTVVVLRAGLLEVDDVEGVRDVELHVGQLEVEPLVVSVRVDIRVDQQFVRVTSNLQPDSTLVFLTYKQQNSSETSSLSYPHSCERTGLGRLSSRRAQRGRSPGRN